MIFRTIQDENAKYGVRLQNRPLAAIKDVVGTKEGVSFDSNFTKSLNSDIEALSQYKAALNSGMDQQRAFNTTMGTASSSAQAYAKQLKVIKTEIKDVATGKTTTANDLEDGAINQYQTQQQIAKVGTIASDHSWKNSIQLINEYNSGLKTQGNICKETGLSQQQLTQGIGQGNAVMGNYLGTLNGAEAKMGGYVKSLITAKAASIGLQIASTAMNMAITMGVSLAIQGIITLADKLIVTSKEAIQAGEDAQQAIGDIQKTYTDKVELVSNSTDRFIELLKGVNEEGQNVSLSTDDYNEFLDISNQLADAFPTLTRTYDENGSAIVHLNGDAQSINTTLQQLLETERELSNQKITENLDDVFNGFKTKAKQNENQLQNAENRLKSYQSIVDMLSSDASNSLSVGSSYSLTGLNPEHAQKLLDIFDKYFHTYYDMGDGNGDTTLTIIPDEYNEQALKDHYDEIKKEIDNTYGDFANYYAAKANESSAEIKEINNKQKSEWSQLAKDMIVWVQTTSQYQEYSDSQRNAIQKLIDNFDYQNFKFDNLEDFKNFLTDKLMTVFDDEETSNQITAFLDIKTKFNDNEVSVADFKNQVDSLNKYLDDNITDEEVKTQIKFSLGIDGSESATISQQVDDILSDLGKDSDAKFKEWINSLNSSEFEIVKELKLDTDAATWTLDEWKQKVEGEATIRATLDFKIADSKADIEKISTAATESNSATGLSDDSIYNIKNIFGEIEDYNESKIFEQTANGIKLNTDELHRLQDAQVDIQKKKFDKSLKILDGQYNNLTESLTECSKQLEDYSTLSEKDRQKLIEKSDSLIKQRNAVVDNISAISALSSQYSALTSAYNEWLSAKDGSEDGDTYDTIRSGLKDIQELYEKGLVGTNEFESYMKLITGTDYSNASIDTITEAYKNLSKEIDNTGYSVKDFLKADQQGVENFLNAASKIKDSGITENDGVWDIQIKDTEQLAENLHISEEFLEAMLLKLRDYKFDINFDDEVSEKYKKLSEYAEKANEELIKSGKVKTAFNFNSQSVEEAQSQIDTFFKELEDDKGKIHLDSTEAANAVKVLDALQSKRDQLNKPAILAVNTDSIKDADAELADGVDLVQQFANASRELNNLNEKKKIDATIDTTEAQKKVQNLASKLQKLGSTETGAKLSLNDTAVQTTLNNIKNTKISPKVSISQTDLDTINAKIAAINPEDVKIGSDSSDLESDVQKAKTLLDEIKDKKIKIDVNGNATNTLSDILDKQSKVKNKEVTYTITYKEKGKKTGNGSVDGTAHHQGTAFHNGTSGDWRVGFDGVSLGGELGEELLVILLLHYIVICNEKSI